MTDKQEMKGLLKGLHQNLRLLYATGHIDSPAYNIGMQVLSEMASSNCLEVVMTWEGMASTLVRTSGVIVADAAPGTAYEFYGALQQLQEAIGLLSNVTREGLQADILQAQETGEAPHVTRMPGEDVRLIGPKTRLLFQYLPAHPEQVASLVGAYTEQATFLDLPSWVAK